MTDATNDIIYLPEDALPELDELTGDTRLLAELIGVKAALIVAQVLCGTPIRCSGWKKWTRAWRDRCIRRDYDTGQITQIELARKYKLTDRWIAEILKTSEPVKVERQQRLFRSSLT